MAHHAVLFLLFCFVFLLLKDGKYINKWSNLEEEQNNVSIYVFMQKLQIS